MKVYYFLKEGCIRFFAGTPEGKREAIDFRNTNPPFVNCRLCSCEGVPQAQRLVSKTGFTFMIYESQSIDPKIRERFVFQDLGLGRRFAETPFNFTDKEVTHAQRP